MQFGFTLKPEHTPERTLALTRQAEAAGFEYGWLFDSHVLWRDPYPLLTLMTGVTERMRLGQCGTNTGAHASRIPGRVNRRSPPQRSRHSMSSRVAGWTSVSAAAIPRGASSASHR